MSSKREAYRFHEDTLLAELKLRKPPMTWKEITDSFNSAMPENRQRTIHGLKYEWRKIKHNYLPSNPAETQNMSSLPNGQSGMGQEPSGMSFPELDFGAQPFFQLG